MPTLAVILYDRCYSAGGNKPVQAKKVNGDKFVGITLVTEAP